MRDIFTNIYIKKRWGLLSGFGSNTELNKEYFDFVNDFIDKQEIKTVVDLGCGDFRLSRELFLGREDIEYTGIDCVSFIVRLLSKIYNNDKHIKFIEMDFFNHKDNIPSGDLMIIKDVLQHWDNHSIYEFMDYITTSGKYKHLIIINSCEQKKDDKDIERIGKIRFLSANFLPLKKYKPKIVLHYIDKEVSTI